MVTLLLGQMDPLQGSANYDTWQFQRKTLFQSRSLWYNIEPGIDLFKDMMRQQAELTAAVERLEGDQRPGASEHRQKMIELLEDYETFKAENREAGEHAERTIAARHNSFPEMRVVPLTRPPLSNYRTWATELMFWLVGEGVWYVIDERDEENEEGCYDTPYTNLRDRDDATARYLISTALKPDQMRFVMHEKTAKKAWERVKRVYGRYDHFTVTHYGDSK